VSVITIEKQTVIYLKTYWAFVFTSQQYEFKIEHTVTP